MNLIMQGAGVGEPVEVCHIHHSFITNVEWYKQMKFYMSICQNIK